jgi:phage shock protein E
MTVLRLFLLLAFCGTGVVRAQTALPDRVLESWRTNGVRFAVFDIRGDAQIDSIVWPCFYTTQPEQWIDSLCRTMRVVISCHAGIAAQAKAQEIAGNGYPADSLFYTGYNLQARHYTARDTLPLAFLRQDLPLPQSMPAATLWAITLSRRPHQLIDVRSTAETASGMIPGACNLIWSTQFQGSLAQLDKNKDLILYCASGNRSGQARDYLLQNGFAANRVINFGGFSKWSALSTASITTAPSAACLCQCLTTGIGPLRSGTPQTMPALTPLPFNHELTISGLMDECSGLTVYNQHGSAVRTFAQHNIRQGTVVWEGTDNAGRQQPPGMYVVRILNGSIANDFTALKIK